jgi:DNA polymerase-3 subunit delta'
MTDSWLENNWQTLLRTRQQQKLSHAVLLQGPVGIGKDNFANQLSQAMLCQQIDKTGLACGQCQSCRLFSSGTHPDFQQISPEEAGKAIKVDQIRQMTSALTMTSHAGGYKVVVITPADSMNINAANSLLKTLEEPTDNTLMLLVSAVPARLPATVRSRCQTYTCVLPETGVAQKWLSQQLDEGEDVNALLELANGAPYTALRLQETEAIGRWLACLEQLAQLANGQLDPVTTAAVWNKKDGLQQVDWFLQALQRMIVTLKTGQQVEQDRLATLINGDLHNLDHKRLFILMDNISYAINNWSTGLNTQLLIEDILISWAAIFRRSALASGQN